MVLIPVEGKKHFKICCELNIMGSYHKKYFRNYKKQIYQSQWKTKPNELKLLFYNCGIENGLKYSTLRKYWYWTRCLILNSNPILHPYQMADHYVISFVDNLIKSKLCKTSVMQAIDALRFLYAKVLGNRKGLVKELVKKRKYYSKILVQAKSFRKSTWKFNRSWFIGLIKS